MLVVDDEFRMLEKNHGNHIPIAPFTGASDDTELPLLARYLLSVSTRPNLCAIEIRLLSERPERNGFLMDKRVEFFGQCRVAHVVECYRLTALRTREIPRNVQEGIIAGRAFLSG